MDITNINDLQKYANGAVVELPEFGEGQKFIARLGRPSLLELMRTGEIPNDLLGAADAIFNGNQAQFQAKGGENFKKAHEVLERMVKAAMLEPTYDAMKAAGVTLTDEQLLAIFNYTQQGIRALLPFRTE